MSGRLMERALDASAGLQHAPARVLFVLARYANDDGSNCFPSLETIAVGSNMLKRAVIRCIAQLCAAGLVEEEKGGGRGKVSRYRLTFGPAPKRVTPCHPKGAPKGDTVSSFKVVNGDTASLFPALNGDIESPFEALKGDMVSPDSNKTLRKKDSEAYASDAGAASPPPSSRDLVWSQGVPLVRHLTGKTDAQCRSMLGRMLRDVRDDCPRLLMVLQQARDFQPIDPVAWLTAATKPRSVKAGRDERILRAAGLWEDDTATFDHEPRGMLQ
jgi:hypothetical protein